MKKLFSIFSFALLVASSSAMAGIVNYNYSGTVGTSPGLSFVGQAIQATFVIDTGVAPVDTPPARYYPFSVLSATYTFSGLGLTFHSTPYADFNTAGSYLGGLNLAGGSNKDFTQINLAAFNTLNVQVSANDHQGGGFANGMNLQVTDYPGFGAISSLAIPMDFSGLSLSLVPGNDNIILSMGYCSDGGVCSTITSKNGSLTVTSGTATSGTDVPEPATYALFLAGLGVLGFAARRRKQAYASA